MFVLVVVLTAGLSIAILTPPLKGADERDHFTRAYQLAHGDISVHRHGSRYGAVLPSGYEWDESQLSNTVYLDRDHVGFLGLLGQRPPAGPPTFTQAGTVASYGPGAYVAYVPAILLGQLLGASLAVDVYLARIAGVIAYGLLMSLAVRRVPVHQWVFVAVALVPEALNQAATVSADGMTMALTTLLIADYLRVSSDPSQEPPPTRIVLEIAVVSLLLALAKPPYIAFVLMFAVPAWRQRRRLGAELAIIVGSSVLVSGLWVNYQRTRSVSLDLPHLTLFSGSTSEFAYRDIHVRQQTTYIATEPWQFARTIWNTVEHQGTALPKQMIGLLAQYQIPSVVVVLSVSVLVVACLVPDEPPTVSLGLTERVSLMAISLTVALAICGIVYVTANALHAPRIDQLTPRYFLPLMAPIIISVLPRSPWRAFRTYNIPRAFVQVGSVTALAATVLGVAHSFYGPSHLV